MLKYRDIFNLRFRQSWKQFNAFPVDMDVNNLGTIYKGVQYFIYNKKNPALIFISDDTKKYGAISNIGIPLSIYCLGEFKRIKIC